MKVCPVCNEIAGTCGHGVSMVSDNPLIADQVSPITNTNTNPAVWPLVIEDMRMFLTPGVATVVPFVIQDMQDRDVAGRKKYGTSLQPYNGRDALVDLYQELLDAAVYARQALFEGIVVDQEYVEILKSVLSIRERIDARRKIS